MIAAGLPPRTFDVEGREAELSAFLARADRPRAVVCWGDLDAVPLLGLAIIDQGGRTVGRLAAEAVLGRMGGRSEPRHVLVEPSLVPRRSL